MKNNLLAFLMLITHVAFTQNDNSFKGYHIYAGNTHSHTINTISHGAHLSKAASGEKSLLIDSNYLNRPGETVQLNAGWEKVQGQPEKHFEIAKENGYDFYVVTDHSQEEAFFPNHKFNTAWIVAHKQAELVSNNKFSGIVGFEFSENDGPGGKGHINVINSKEYLNALEPRVDLKYFYKWLQQQEGMDGAPVVASFNHPGPTQYDDFANRDDSVTNMITMLEVINSNSRIHYDGFIKALDKGWKVSPVCGNDNHGIDPIEKHTSRTFVLATTNSRKSILEAMKNRRTYASLEKNIQCMYAVNDALMGSTINKAKSYKFNISISDPDINDVADKITKIDIVKDGGKVVETYTVPQPSHTVKWTPTITDNTASYFTIRVWNASGGDAKGANPEKPIAWLAPIWIGK